MNMNKINTIFAGLAAVGAFLSCDPNKVAEFDDKDAFVGFEEAEYEINETGGSISIPVTVASINGVGTTVSYSISSEDAKEGADYTLADPSAVLTFDATERTKNIVINIVAMSGVYTGDKVFTVSLDNASAVNLGADKTCEVTIADLDHPLADILGTYAASGTSKFDGALSWSATFSKDASDVNTVWISGLGPAPFTSSNFAFYGTVSEDHKIITIPVGQTKKYSSAYNCALYVYDLKYIYDETEVPSVKLIKGDDGAFHIDDYGFSFYALKASDNSGAGNFELLLPGITYLKK